MEDHLKKYCKYFFKKKLDHINTGFVSTFSDEPQVTVVGFIRTQNDLLIACVDSNAHQKIGGSV